MCRIKNEELRMKNEKQLRITIFCFVADFKNHEIRQIYTDKKNNYKLSALKGQLILE
jgi:hypothetical protein